jgi:hypothetical protein
MRITAPNGESPIGITVTRSRLPLECSIVASSDYKVNFNTLVNSGDLTE